jgi:hypothetical protein
MRPQTIFAFALAALMLFPQGVVAHEAKEYTFLLREDGSTPSSVEAGILVETDSLFFMNVDDRDGVSHRVQVDADADGSFEGLDDFATQWLNASCEQDANGSKLDEGCVVTELVLLAPENGLLPGNISMRHQIRSDSGTSNRAFYVNYTLDVHVQPNLPPTPSPTGQDAQNGNQDPLALLLVLSLLGILVIAPRLMGAGEEE